MKLAVLFGGISSEHDISCLSAASILRNLNKDKYEIYPVGITRDGEWFYCPDCDPDRVESGAWERMTGKGQGRSGTRPRHARHGAAP